MRLALHSGVILALLISFSQAPHAHFHPDDPDHDHDHDHHAEATAFVDVDHEPALAEPDHDSTARVKDWLAGDGTAPTKQYAESVSVVKAAVLLAVRHSVPILSVRNHDPPTAHVQPARGPPVPSCL